MTRVRLLCSPFVSPVILALLLGCTRVKTFEVFEYPGRCDDLVVNLVFTKTFETGFARYDLLYGGRELAFFGSSGSRRGRGPVRLLSLLEGVAHTAIVEDYEDPDQASGPMYVYLHPDEFTKDDYAKVAGCLLKYSGLYQKTVRKLIRERNGPPYPVPAHVYFVDYDSLFHRYYDQETDAVEEFIEVSPFGQISRVRRSETSVGEMHIGTVDDEGKVKIDNDYILGTRDSVARHADRRGRSFLDAYRIDPADFDRPE